MFRLAVLLLLALVVAVGAAACGGGEEASPTADTVETGGGTDTDDGTETETEEMPTETEPGGAQGDPANGKEIFAAQACGSCHTLSDAGTSGTIGPNLDDSQPDFELVVDRVTNGSGAMPSFEDKLSEEEINDVAAYVTEAAG